MDLLDPGSCISASAAPSYDGLTLGSWAMPYPCGPLSCLYVSPANSCDIRDIFFLTFCGPAMHFQLGLVQGLVSFWAWANALLGF